MATRPVGGRPAGASPTDGEAGTGAGWAAGRAGAEVTREPDTRTIVIGAITVPLVLKRLANQVGTAVRSVSRSPANSARSAGRVQLDVSGPAMRSGPAQRTPRLLGGAMSSAWRVKGPAIASASMPHDRWNSRRSRSSRWEAESSRTRTAQAPPRAAPGPGTLPAAA